MKKIPIILMCACICFSLTSCRKSANAANVDSLIAAIGDVTLESESKIKQAEEAVDSLNTWEQKSLENTEILKKARSTYNELLKIKIQDSITAIGSVTLNSEETIIATRNLYDNSPELVKTSIENYFMLESAEEELSSLKIKQTIKLISAIGKVTLNKENKINAAQTAYNNLSVLEKKEVTNADVLHSAIDKVTQLKTDAAISKLQTKIDKVDGITWYHSKYEDFSSQCYVVPYIGKNSEKKWLRLKYYYTNNSWIFFESVTIFVDGTRYNKTFNYSDIEHDNGSYSVWEWADISPSKEDIEMLKAIANSEESIVRFRGDNYHYDLTITDDNKTAIKDILTAYELL